MTPTAVDNPRRASRGVGAAALVFTLAGIAALIWLIRQAGVASLLASLKQVCAALPLVLALEAGRVFAEFWSMRSVLGTRATGLAAARLLRAQLLCSALSTVMPAGRAVGESAKAASLAGVLPVPVAAATGAMGQVLTFIVNGCTGVAGGLLAWRLGYARFGGACLAFGALLLAVGVTLLAGMRSARLAAAFGRHRLTASWAEPFLRASRALAVGALGLGGALIAQLVARLLQGVQLALLVLALGHTNAWIDAPVLQSIYTLGAAIGDLVPAQLGTVDAAFALASPLLGLAPSAAVALGLSLHAIQLAGAALCFAGLLLPTRAKPQHAHAGVSRPTELA